MPKHTLLDRLNSRPSPPTQAELRALQRGPAINAFVGGFKEQAFPFETPGELGRSLLEPVRHPVQTGRAVLGAMQEQFGKGVETLGEGLRMPTGGMPRALQGLEAAGRFAASAVPIFGPEAAKIGETFGRGEFARGAGQAAALLSPFGISKALRGVPARRDIGPVPLTRSERPRGTGFHAGGKIPRFLENLTERTLPGAGVFARFRVRQQKAVQELASQTVDSISSFRGTALEAGRATKVAILAARDALKLEAGALYQKIDDLTRQSTVRRPVTVQEASRLVGPQGEPLSVPRRVQVKTAVGGVGVPTAVLKREAIKILRRIKEESKLFPPTELARVRRLLQQIVKAPRTVSFQVFQDTRSDLLALVRSSAKDPIPGRAGGVAKHLSKETDQLMMQAAERSGIPGLVGLVDEANVMWEKMKKQFNGDMVKKLLKESPEDVHRLLASGDLDGIFTLKSLLPPKQFQVLKARLVRDMLDEATTGELQSRFTVAQTAGVTKEGVFPPTPAVPGMLAEVPVVLNGARFTKLLENLGDAHLDLIFGPAEKLKLLELGQLATRIGAKASDMVPGLMAGGINVGLLTALTGFGLVGGKVALGTVAGFNVLARLMTRPEGLTGLRRFVRALGQGRASEAMTVGLQLTKLIEQEEYTVSDVREFHDEGDAREPTSLNPSEMIAILAGRQE